MVKITEELKKTVNEKGMNEVLTYEEAYCFSLMNYNKGGDGFVECCGRSDYDRIELIWGDEPSRVWGNTKADLMKEMNLFDDVRRDAWGW